MTSSTAAEAACAFEFPANQGENYEKMEFRLHSRVAELVGDQIRAFYDDGGGGGGGSWRIGPRALRSVVETNVLQDGDAFSEHPIYGSAIAVSAPRGDRSPFRALTGYVQSDIISAIVPSRDSSNRASGRMSPNWEGACPTPPHPRLAWRMRRLAPPRPPTPGKICG